MHHTVRMCHCHGALHVHINGHLIPQLRLQPNQWTAPNILLQCLLTAWHQHRSCHRNAALLRSMKGRGEFAVQAMWRLPQAHQQIEGNVTKVSQLHSWRQRG